MKKIFILWLAFAGNFSLKAQNSPECSNAERILLNERNPEISEREAYDIIKNPGKALLMNATTVGFPTKLFPPRYYEKLFCDMYYLVKSNDGVGYEWKVSTVYSSTTEEMLWWQFIVGIGVCFVLGIGIFFLSGIRERKMITRRLLALGVSWIVSGVAALVVLSPSTINSSEARRELGTIGIYVWLFLFAASILGGIAYVLFDQERRSELFQAINSLKKVKRTVAV